MKRLSGGFTLVELILVIVIMGALAGMVTVFLRPAMEGYVAQRGRSELQGAAEAALRVMNRDLRRAVPNSIRSPSNQCFELMPTIGGGRYRLQADKSNDASCSGATCSAPVDTTTTTSQFDVLGPLNGSAAIGDYIVIGNQNGSDAYGSRINRNNITGFVAGVPSSIASQRIAINPIQFPSGYAGGRFVVVPDAEQAVFFVCSGAGLDASRTGTGTLRRLKRYGFNAGYPGSCPAGGDVIATQVSACDFSYQGTALSEYGLMSLRIEVSRNNETVGLQMGTMVSNLP